MATAKKSITKLASEIDLFDRINGTSSKILRPVEEFLSLPLLIILRWCHIFISWVREKTLTWGNPPLAVWWLCQRSDIRPSTLREAGRAASWLGSRDGFDYPTESPGVSATHNETSTVREVGEMKTCHVFPWVAAVLYCVFALLWGSNRRRDDKHVLRERRGRARETRRVSCSWRLAVTAVFAGSAGSHSGVSSRWGSISSDAHPAIVILQS